MKFESEFGLGEIVATKPPTSTDRQVVDQLLEVVAISFGKEGGVDVVCRYPQSGILQVFKESELDGDPSFNQEHGYA